jgi:hypothetical protein
VSDGNLLPLLLLSGLGSSTSSGSAGGGRLDGLLPLLLLAEGGLATSSCAGTSWSSESPAFAPVLADQIKRYRGCRVKLVLATNTLYPGGQLIIATIREILKDYVVIDEIEVNGVPIFDPSFLLLETEQIEAIEPIPPSKFLLELLWKVRAFQRCRLGSPSSTTS